MRRHARGATTLPPVQAGGEQRQWCGAACIAARLASVTHQWLVADDAALDAARRVGRLLPALPLGAVQRRPLELERKLAVCAAVLLLHAEEGDARAGGV